MWPHGLAKQHPTAALLDEYSNNGCPVEMGVPWTIEGIVQALKTGPHISVMEPIPAKVLREETEEKVKEGYIYAKIDKWLDIEHNVPKNLKTSPIAMIPHKIQVVQSHSRPPLPAKSLW